MLEKLDICMVNNKTRSIYFFLCKNKFQMDQRTWYISWNPETLSRIQRESNLSYRHLPGFSEMYSDSLENNIKNCQKKCKKFKNLKFSAL